MVRHTLCDFLYACATLISLPLKSRAHENTAEQPRPVSLLRSVYLSISVTVCLMCIKARL